MQICVRAIILRFSFTDFFFGTENFNISTNSVINLMIKTIIFMYSGMLRHVDQTIITDPPPEGP